MQNVFLQLRRLNSKSTRILSELNEKEPSLETLKNSMNERQKSIDELDLLIPDFQKSQLSKKDAESLDILFSKFRDLNLKIVEGLDEVMRSRRKQIANIVKQQKVLKSYQVSEQPDISYFQQK